MGELKCYHSKDGTYGTIDEKCYKDIYTPPEVREIQIPGYEPVEGRNLLIKLPIECRTVEIFKRLRVNYGFSLMYWSGDYEELIRLKLAGYTNNQLVLNVSCNIEIEGKGSLQHLISDSQHAISINYRGRDVFIPEDSSPLHAIHVDEPQNQESADCTSDTGKNHLNKIKLFAHKNNTEFIIANYNSIFNNWWKEYMNYADSIIYSGYEYNIFDDSQRADWTDIDNAKYPDGRSVSGKRAWASLSSDRDEFDDLFGHANKLRFKELWIFGTLLTIPLRCHDGSFLITPYDDPRTVYGIYQNAISEIELLEHEYRQTHDIRIMHKIMILKQRADSVLKYLKMFEKCNGKKDCDSYVDAYINNLCEIAQKNGWLKRKTVKLFYPGSTRRYFCQHGDCSKCDKSDIDSKDWSSIPLPLCWEKIVEKEIRSENKFAHNFYSPFINDVKLF